ncbi:MAG TPA: hypothetical protein PLH57_00780 [Oligoflexia bacterium]|nr:hypothetical protein [Oligoflexia bacterium]
MKHWKILLVVTALTSGSLGFSHEGHDHSPGQVQAPNNGQLQKTKDIYVEVAGTKEEVKIYFYDTKLQPLGHSGIKVRAELRFPERTKKNQSSHKSKAKKNVAIELKDQGDYFSGPVVVGSAHRYLVDLDLVLNGRSEKLTFQVEP